MTTAEFLDLLIHAISSEDWQRLDRGDPSLVITNSSGSIDGISTRVDLDRIWQ